MEHAEAFAAPLARDSATRGLRQQLVTAWLLSICAMVLAMIVVGGITRLTGSGLSITEWKPIMGAIPPLNEGQWLEAFAKYKLIPQYRLVNPNMTLAGFKWIFFWEFTHRLLGRSIGLMIVLPWIFFARKGWVSRKLHARLATAMVLFALQGLMGWIMVASGLSERTSVSHYRLAAHLSLALTTLGYLLWVIRSELPLAPISQDAQARAVRNVGRGVRALLVLVGVQIVYGAFMAGLKAGFMYSTFPAMNGRWFPAGGLVLAPAWLNFLENPATVHFMHRTLGWLVVAGGFALWGLVRMNRPNLPKNVRIPAMASSHTAIMQFLLGVTTVVTHVALPVAVIHQVVGSLLLAALLWTRFTIQKHPRQQ